MKTIFATCAAVAVTALIALPGSVSAIERRADGVQTQQAQTGSTEFSDQRRRYRSRYYSGRRYYSGPRYYSGYSAPYYAYQPRPYYRPYYGPRVGVGVGPFGFGLGF
jgi:hypothetical protein